MRLDHLIATVPDIRTSHARLLARGFEEAWAIGPFWPDALTSGVALGGTNLELVQPDSGTDRVRIETLVLAPDSFSAGRTALRRHGLAFEDREKVESDPARLALRGFPSDKAATPQTICTNLYPADPDYPFFLCLYAPFLKSRLAPSNFAQPHGPVTALTLVAPDPPAVRRLFEGWLGPLGFDVEDGERPEATAIRFADGSTLTPAAL